MFSMFLAWAQAQQEANQGYSIFCASLHPLFSISMIAIGGGGEKT